MSTNLAKLLNDNKLNILIVEDDEISYKLIKKAITNDDRNILHATSGKEALGWIEACGSEFSLIVMDYHLPGESGIEITRKINAISKNIPLMFVTAEDSYECLEEALKEGALDYILKPINPNIIKAKVDLILNVDEK